MRISDWSSDVCSSDLGIILVPLCARAQRENLAERHAVIGTSLELGDIGGDEIADALDLAVADRGAKQRRRHRLGDREGNPFVFGFLAEAIFLEHDLAMTDYEKTRDALARNILVDRDGASIVVQDRKSTRLNSSH